MGGLYDKFVCFSYNTAVLVSPECDKVYEYSVLLLRLACFYMEFADAIREGDCGCILRCWKHMLPLFSGSGNKSYTSEPANILVQHFVHFPHTLLICIFHVLVEFDFVVGSRL